MPWVHRTAGVIDGLFARQQVGMADELLASNNAEVLAFLAAQARTKRTLFAIRADIVALTAAQKNNAWTALLAGSPPLWSTDAGPNAAALAVLELFGASATLSAADVLEAKIRAAALYAQDNPRWLVNPVFDVSINIAGDQ